MAEQHLLAVNPYKVTDNELQSIAGDRIHFYKPAGEVFTEEQQWNSWSTGKADSDWFRPDRLSGSDYSGGFVYRSNFLAFREEWEDENAQTPFFVGIYGGHGTYGIALFIPNTPREVWEALLKLEQYPSLDDDRVGALEMEAADEAWESWAKDDYKKLWAASDLGSDGDPDYAEGWVDEISDVDWYEHFHECMQTANVYWEPQGDAREVFVDVQRVFEECDEPPDRGGTPSAGPSSPPSPTESEPPPRFNWTQGQIREFKRRGLRQGYDFNPGPPNYVGTPHGINKFLADDPYKGILIPDRFADFNVSRGGMLVNNLTHDQNPHERAMLLIKLDDGLNAEIVAWWREKGGFYTVAFINPRVLPKTLTTVGKLGEVVDGLGRKGEVIDEDDWDIVLRSMKLNGGLDARSVYVRWYDDSGVEPFLRDYEPEVFVQHYLGPTELIQAYTEVFDVYDQREKSVNEIMSLLGERGSAPEEPPPAPPDLGEDPRRRQHLDYLREQLDRPYVRRFEPNAGQPLFSATEYPFESFLKNDPFRSLFIKGNNDVFSVHGRVQHNVAWDDSVYERAMLLIRDDVEEGVYLVCWWEKAGPDAIYTVTVFDLRDVMRSGARDWDPRIPLLTKLTADEWKHLTHALELTPPPAPALALYYRLWDDAELTPRLWDTAKLSNVSETWEVSLASLKDAYPEVFADPRYQRALEEAQASGLLEPQPQSVEPEAERAPRYSYPPGAIREFKRRGMRPGYDFNPGLAAGMVPEQFDPVELARGTFVEMEHTDDVEEAQRIAMDHLVEDGDYYRKLQVAGL